MGATAGLTRSDTAVGAEDAQASAHPPILWEGAVPILLRAAALSIALVVGIAVAVIAGLRALE